ncbi:MAG: hypothetical protein ABI604_10475 [Nitrospirota bacterium]
MVDMKNAGAKLLVVVTVFLLAGSVAVNHLNKILAKRFGRESLEQTAVVPSAWRPHELNITYGKGGNPDTAKYYNTHNAQGFKYPRDIPKEKPAKTIRVFAMGGSTLYGWGSEGLENYGNHKPLANDESITYFLETALNKEIRKQFPDWSVEVINAGVIDYNSAFHLVYYNQKIWQYHPDMVVFVDGNNEFFGMKPWNTFDEYRNTGVNVVNSFNDRDLNFTLYVGSRYLAQYSSVFKSAQYKFLSKWLEHEAQTVNRIYELPDTLDGFEESYDKKAREFLRTYAELKTAIEFDGAKVLLFLGPQLQMEDEKLLGPKDHATLIQVRKDQNVASAKVERGEFMRRVRARLPYTFETIGFPYIDVSNLASEGERVDGLYIDYCHVTPKGAKVYADKMLRSVKQGVLAAIQKGVG